MGARRILGLCFGFLLLTIALATASLHGRALMAEGYLRYANERLRSGDTGTNSRVAADLAVRLSPFPARPHAVRAAILEAGGERAAALEESRKALKSGGNNPFLWLAHAHLKLRLGQTDDELTTALRRLDQLAPHDFWIHQRNARLGLQYWNWGKPEHQALWRKSIEFVIRTDGRSLLSNVVISHQEKLFCREFKTSTPLLEPWCSGVLRARQLCYAQAAGSKLHAWCKRYGLSPDSLDG
jgi:hypothetical protein